MLFLFEYNVFPQAGDDMRAAGTQLHRLGVKTVALVGASFGGTACLVAARSMTPAPALVVSMSAPAELFGVHALPAVQALKIPILFVDSQDDTPYSHDARTMYTAAVSPSKKLKIVPGSAHGIAIFDAPGGSRVRDLIVAFIRQHTSR